MNTHACSIIITKLGKVQFIIRFLLILHHRFDNATQFSVHEYDQKKIENKKTLTK